MVQNKVHHRAHVDIYPVEEDHIHPMLHRIKKNIYIYIYRHFKILEIRICLCFDMWLEV